MLALHHVWLAPADPRWALLAQALVGGDTVVLLDGIAQAHECALPGVPGVRWCTPAGAPAAGVPGIEMIEDTQWWALIAAHPKLLEWA